MTHSNPLMTATVTNEPMTRVIQAAGAQVTKAESGEVSSTASGWPRAAGRQGATLERLPAERPHLEGSLGLSDSLSELTFQSPWLLTSCVCLEPRRAPENHGPKLTLRTAGGGESNPKVKVGGNS